MDGENCRNCADSPWVQRANSYVNNISNRRDRVETVRFLLRHGFCGIAHRVGINDIRSHLSGMGYNYDRSGFQQEILTELKREGIVATLIYPGPRGGVFIPCSQEEVRSACQQGFQRVIQLLSNLEGSAVGTALSEVISSARREMEHLERKI